MNSPKSIPHPFPYQGSKRRIAADILARMPAQVDVLYEPFAGSGALTIAAAMDGRARSFVLADLNGPLVSLWRAILAEPEALCDDYERLWFAQEGREPDFYGEVRLRFNQHQRPADLLYILARCVKAAVRYNVRGEFNNSPDHRRRGMRPATMRANILAVSSLLAVRAKAVEADYRDVLAQAGPADLVYMDPPYQGVSNTRDHRYIRGLDRAEFVGALEDLNARRVPYIISYDGRTGDKTYGEELPSHLGLTRYEVFAGQSSQATLLGKSAETHESLYVSAAVTAPPCAARGRRARVATRLLFE